MKVMHDVAVDACRQSDEEKIREACRQFDACRQCDHAHHS
jgi:hypothetical protein